MKRPKDNEADSFGIAVTMRGKHNCTPAWVSLETHYTVETRTRTHTKKFPPIVITGTTQKDSPNVTSNGLYTEAQSGCYKVSPLADRETPAERDHLFIMKSWETLSKNCLYSGV